jgi:acetylornithine deacetylase/succinyl-diaminopimelate desuccinylase-like protein
VEKSPYLDAVSIAQKLIQFDTTNGEKPEKDCIAYIKELLENAGIKTELIYNTPERPNLMAVYPSKNPRKDIPPFLMYGHVDVVSVKEQKWEKEAFSGIIEDGYLWGRGAIDMKGEHGMFLETMLKLAYEKVELPFDVCYLAVSDEEGMSNYGMKYLVENHREIFNKFKYAIGEIGGFSLNISGKKLYPIQIAEKQMAEIKITAHGAGGHASMKHKETAMKKMAEAITTLSTKRLPVRITEPVSLMINSMAEAIGGAKGLVIKQLLNPKLTDSILNLLGDTGSVFDPLLHNSLNVTMVGGGTAINVIPSAVWCKCDLRLVPQCAIEEAIEDIKGLIGHEFDVEVLNFNQGSQNLDMSLYESMADVILQADSEAYPIPFVLSAVTDARFLSKIGIQTYGFTPMNLPKDYDFISMAHNANERVPVDALKFGSKLIYQYITKNYEGCFNGK